MILAVRTLSRGETAKESIESSTDRKGVVEVWQLDLGNYGSVKDFAKKVERLDRLDVLVENAGIATEKFSLLEDNEATITTNVVSTFLLALLLLPKLRESGQKFNITPHLVIVCSEVHAWSPMNERKSDKIFDTLNNKETADMTDRYSPRLFSFRPCQEIQLISHRYQISKLLQVFPTRELTTRANQDGKPPIIINYLNPGLCQSELSRDSGYFLSIMKFFLARTTEHGSRSLVHAAQAGEETNGQYLSDCRVKP